MTENKSSALTDAEIIKALELCAFIEKGGCKECPYHSYANCSEMKVAETVNLINRQKAEIEKLRKELNIVSTLYQDEQERYKALLDGKCDRCIARDKAEAVKEFAERLKENLVYCKTVVEGNDMVGITDVGYEKEDAIATIDNLLEEMGGEDK